MRMVEESQGQERPLAQNNRLSLCTSTVPVLLGLCRALGRFNGCEDPLIAHIFPPKKRRRVARCSKTSDVQNKVRNYCGPILSRLRKQIFSSRRSPTFGASFRGPSRPPSRTVVVATARSFSTPALRNLSWT